MTRTALCGFVAAVGILPLIASAQAQTASISASTVAPSRVIPRLDALPQITAAQRAAPRMDKPFLHPMDPLTFAAEKAEAERLRFIPQGVTSSDVPAQMESGLSVPEESLNQTVNPPETTFNGISNATCAVVNGGLNFRPSDMGLAVGDTLVGVLQGVNDCLSVFDKNGVQQPGFPKSTPTFLGTALNTSDPRMIFDWINHRYLFVVVSYPNSCAINCTAPAFYSLAVSTSDSPNAGWCLYNNIPVQTTPNPSGGFYAFPDYPRLGQDREAVYLASNLFRPSYIGEEILAIRKTELYACVSAPITNVTGLSNGFTIQPANVFSASDDPKSMYFVTSFFATTNQLVVSSFHSPFSSPTFTQVTITAANTYSIPPDATQQGTATLIATGDQRISGSAYYAAGSIYAALATNGGNGQPGILLYQIQPFVNTSGGVNDGKITGARILNEILRAGGGSNAWYYPAQQPDPEGNVTEVFGFSSASNYASLAYASRRAAQAVGTVPDGGVFAAVGLGPYVTGNPQRWGDYFATAPAGLVSGGGTGGFPKMWFSGQYASGTSTQWNTIIGRTGYSGIGQD
jgi:hypothetical protein